VLAMVYIVVLLTILLGIAYAVYRTAKAESVGFKALLAWVFLAIVDATAIIAWAAWSLFQS
jgi:hypothetical protein